MLTRTFFSALRAFRLTSGSMRTLRSNLGLAMSHLNGAPALNLSPSTTDRPP